MRDKDYGFFIMLSDAKVRFYELLRKYDNKKVMLRNLNLCIDSLVA